jgi:hypothetical protein
MTLKNASTDGTTDPLALAIEVLANPHRYTPTAETLAKALIADHKRYQWAANELLACDYGDNDAGGVGWIVFGWRDVNGVHSVIPRDKVRRIYGSSINDAIDAELP